MKSPLNKVLTFIGLFICFMFLWWLSGYNFNERNPNVARDLFGVIFGTVLVYSIIPFLTSYGRK